ncbi:MAG: hypothetical protein ACQET3_12760 [Promethearchaeati archaeon]
MNSRRLLVLCCLCLLLPFATIQQDIGFVSQTTSDESPVEQHQGYLPSELKIGSGIANVLVVGMDEASIPSARENIASFLSTQGIPVETKTSSELVSQPSPVLNASVIILDASTGSNNGSTASDQLFRVLLASDVPVIMMGRAAER